MVILLLDPFFFGVFFPLIHLQETRLKEGIVRLQPQEEPLRSELLSGKFTVLVGTSVKAASLLLYVP